MKAALFDTWVDALEKPHIWRQGQGELERPEGGFCAMGVLVRNDRWTRGLRRVATQLEVTYWHSGRGMIYTLSQAYLDTIGLSRDTMESVINMNDRELEDGGHVPFPEIAAWLKERRDAIVA